MDLVYRGANAGGRAVLAALGVEVRLHGVERLPVHGPVLLASTHNSFLDFVVLEKAAVRRRRYVRFLTRYDAWVTPPVSWAMDQMRHVPVDRAAPAGAYLTARRLLREGEAVGVFPEAGISHAFTVRALMPGVAALAAETGACVVPVAMWGAQRISSVGNPTTPPPDLTRGRVVDVSVGRPFTVPPGAGVTVWTRYLGEVLTGMLEELQQLPHHRPRPGEVATWYPAHLGGAAADVAAGRALDEIPFSAVPPAWGPAGAAGPGRGTSSASAPGPSHRSGPRAG